MHEGQTLLLDLLLDRKLYHRVCEYARRNQLSFVDATSEVIETGLRIEAMRIRFAGTAAVGRDSEVEFGNETLPGFRQDLEPCSSSREDSGVDGKGDAQPPEHPRTRR